MSAPDRPSEPRGDREGGFRGGDREGGYRGDREGGYRGDREGGYRGDREGGYRGEQSVKSRLRAKARKKARKQRKKGFVRRKVCRFCADSSLPIDYRDAKTLRLFISETGKMIPRRISGNCARHQRPLALAIKRARHLALLPTSANYL